jgi:hypothetical protein
VAGEGGGCRRWQSFKLPLKNFLSFIQLSQLLDMEEVDGQQYGANHEAAGHYGSVHTWHEHAEEERLEEEEEEQEQEELRHNNKMEEEEEVRRAEEEVDHVKNRHEDMRMRDKESKAEFSFTYSPIVHGPKWFPTMVRISITACIN